MDGNFMTSDKIVMGIIGTRLIKDPLLIKAIITYYLDSFKTNNLIIISGGANGVDTIAKDIATLFGLKFKSYLPENPTWKYYQERNKLIVKNSDMI